MSKITFEQGKKIEKILQENIHSNIYHELTGIKNATSELIKFIEEEIINE
jgi:hypothetical protein